MAIFDLGVASVRLNYSRLFSVRNLAQRSAQAARETAVLIEESVAMSKGGGKKVEWWPERWDSAARLQTTVEGSG